MMKRCAMFVGLSLCWSVGMGDVATETSEVLHAMERTVDRLSEIPIKMRYSTTARSYFASATAGEFLPDGRVVVRNTFFRIGDGMTTAPNEKIVLYDKVLQEPYEETVAECVVITSGPALGLQKRYSTTISGINPLNRTPLAKETISRNLIVGYDGRKTRTLLETEIAGKRELRGAEKDGSGINIWFNDLFAPQMAYCVYGRPGLVQSERADGLMVLQFDSGTKFRIDPTNGYMVRALESPGLKFQNKGVAHVFGLALPESFERRTFRDGKLSSEVLSGQIEYTTPSLDEIDELVFPSFPAETRIVDSLSELFQATSPSH